MLNKVQPPSRRTRLWAIVLTPILAIGALTATAVPANAAPVFQPEVASTHSLTGVAATVQDKPAESTVDVSYAPECLEVVESGVSELTNEDCKLTTTTSVSETFAVTADDINADSDLTAAQQQQLQSAVAIEGVTGRQYSQFVTGVAYTRTHNGRFYFDGSSVWVTTPQAGYQGSHSCFTNYAIGISIQGTECSESGGGTWRTLRDTWIVGFGDVGAYSVTMACTVYTDGSIAGPGATIG